MEATTLRPGSALMRKHQGWSARVLSVWGNTTLERFHKNCVCQGSPRAGSQGGLAREGPWNVTSFQPSRCGSNNVSRQGKDRHWTTTQRPKAGGSFLEQRWGVVTATAEQLWAGNPRSRDQGPHWVRLKSMFSPCVSILLLGQSFWRPSTSK